MRAAPWWQKGALLGGIRRGSAQEQVRKQQREAKPGHGPALGLIALGHSKALHWVALDEGDSGRVRVVNSLQPKVRELSIHNFLDERTLSVLLLIPCSSESSKEGSSLAAQHISGTLEMACAATRLQPVQGFTGQ